MKFKSMIIASFIPRQTLSWSLKYLKDKFNINHNNVYIYEIGDDDTEYLMTFKLNITSKINLKHHFKNATIVNFKKGCIFSINGLNRLIEVNSCCEQGNIDYKNHSVNWGEYEDKLVICNKKGLVVKNIKKININFDNL